MRWIIPLLGIGFLFLNGHLSGTVPEEKMARHIFHGGTIRTLDPVTPQVEAIAISEGRILVMGKKSEVGELAGPATCWVDLNGKTLMPSLKDHQVHLLNVGFSILNQARNEAMLGKTGG